MDNITLVVKSMPINNGLVRAVVASYAGRLNPTMEVLSDIKTAVSEAVTNAIIHAYDGSADNDICINASIDGNTLAVKVTDYGKGILNIVDAMRDFYTTKSSEERSGLGFTIMSSFMDSIDVKSSEGEGTTVTLTKKLRD
ncbi:MAG: anti-sigma F factor [Bacillota bacterium]